MTSRTLRTTIAILTASFLLGASALAAPPPKPAKPPAAARPSDEDKAEHQRKMKEGRARLLRKRVGLTEEKAKQVEAVMDRFQKERQEKAKAQHESMKKLRELVKADGVDQAAYTKALGDMEASVEAVRDVMAREKAELKKLLAPKEQARLALAVFKLKAKGKHGGRHGGGEGRGDRGDRGE